MIVFDTNKEIPFFFIHIPQTITYSNFSNFKWLGKFHHGDGGETIPISPHYRSEGRRQVSGGVFGGFMALSEDYRDKCHKI